MRLFAALALVMMVTAGCADHHGRHATAAPSTRSAAPAAAPTAAWTVGQCVNVRFDGTADTPQSGAVALPCAAGAAGTAIPFAQIIKVTAENKGLLDCPSRTDGIVDAPAGGQVCVRNLTAPHPADPGKGGGILRVGDCIYAHGHAQPVERKCYDRHGPGKIKSLLKKKSRCHDAQGYLDGYHTTRRDHPKLPIICHGDGESVEEAGPEFADGDCVEKPVGITGPLPLGGEQILGLHTVACDSGAVWAKVIASVDSGCPHGTSESVYSTEHYPGTTCLRRLRK